MVGVQRTISLSFFGTSIMEHFEAHSPRLIESYDLPQVGDRVVVTEWRRRGWVHALYLGLQATHPQRRVEFDNRGLGGATSRDLLDVVNEAATSGAGPDIAVLGVGINDVWRCFQGRPHLAVHLDEYTRNYRILAETLSRWATRVVCVSETPFGWHDTLDVIAMNRQLAEYNAAAGGIAGDLGLDVVDLWTPILDAADGLEGTGLTPWSDGAHMSEIGDAVIARTMEAHILDAG